MTRVGRILGLAAAVLALSATSADATFAPKDCTRPKVEPNRIVFACGDFGAYIDRLNWTAWRKSRAKGGGRFRYKTCNPDCATGGFREVHAKIRLRRKRTTRCGGQRVPMFTEAYLRFPNRKPPHASAYQPISLYCIP